MASSDKARDPGVREIPRIWHDGWHEAHARLFPGALVRDRSLESLTARLRAAFHTVRVVGPRGAPAGFCMVQDDELYQLYVGPEARGTGAAAAVVADAEMRLRAAGVRVAWLACAIGNERAAGFYAKCGWRRVENLVSQLETAEGIVPLEVWRYEKRLGCECGGGGSRSQARRRV